ncbi:lysosomal alpha-mannosidase-like [Neocloeon triangulifer]|uniref:lysosomal alpha-mannosidase-like n=1 Tax=Neocloeon triangulifer TaxID=2078957 RepID=UPI00286EE430|nr:lysosomal alpha-mannosidase-like [Neocloeon triangulifer]
MRHFPSRCVFLIHFSTFNMGRNVLAFFILSLVIFVNCDPQCGYEACPKTDPNMLTVHLVPHTHDDVGWVRTVDEYYGGLNLSRFNTGVRTIFESVIQQLTADQDRKFIWVETAYFWRWWSSEGKDSLKAIVKTLVARGQLEFTGGAWSMNDEAVNHYQSTIDQFTWGFRRLSDVFGDCGRPHIGWQIDPFGHSRETASLMAQLGFDGLFFGRLDEEDKKHREKTKTMEMIWRGSKNLGKEADLFTGVLFNLYNAPRGFCFDVWCSEFVDENPKTGNFRKKVSEFIQRAREQADNYRTNNIMWTMGADFTYIVASRWYTNLDALMKHVNKIAAETGIAVVYSTPSCYLQALQKANKTWPVKEDDFFPYASEPHSYWTGYFTSRPNLKRFERVGNNLLQVCKQLHVSTGTNETDNLNSLREAMGVLQHHDAITGTEKQYVADDYAKILSTATSKCDESTSDFLSVLSKKDEKETNLKFERCPLLNISQCSVSENEDAFVVTVYNPLARSVSKFVRLPVKATGYKIVDLSNGQELKVQYVPLPPEVNQIPVRKSSANQELVFEATDLPRLGFKSFHVKASKISRQRRQAWVGNDGDKENEISNEFVKVEFNEDTNLMSAISVDNTKLELTQQLMYYVSGKGNHNLPVPLRASGAYIFRPETNDPEEIPNEKATIKSFKGPLVSEIHQTFSPWASQVVRLYKGQKHVEIEWLVGPIPTEDHVGKEVISKFSTKLQTLGEFVTDSNSREYLSRKRDHRDTWDANIQEPVAGNYYPITSALSISDNETTVVILTDRAQGGGSITDGSLELMVHRRLVEDDGYGVSEVLNELQEGQGMVARGRHILLVAPKKSKVTVRQRDLVQREMVLEPTLFFTTTSLSAEDWRQKHVTQFSGLKMDLPLNVNLLTLEPWKDDQILMRLEHTMEKYDDMTWSMPAVVPLQSLFEKQITDVTEMTLGANQELADSQRFEWADERNPSRSRKPNDRFLGKNWGKDDQQAGKNEDDFSKEFKFVLHPMQIRTFVVKFE